MFECIADGKNVILLAITSDSKTITAENVAYVQYLRRGGSDMFAALDVEHLEWTVYSAESARDARRVAGKLNDLVKTVPEGEVETCKMKINEYLHNKSKEALKASEDTNDLESAGSLSA